MNSKKLYRIINKTGNSLDGFKSFSEAQKVIHMMNNKYKWFIRSYNPDNWELN